MPDVLRLPDDRSITKGYQLRMSDDGRRFSRVEQAERRRIAVRLHVEQGVPVADLAATLGLNRETIWRWVRAYERAGEQVFLASDRRGHPEPTMTPAQVAWIVEVVKTKSPRDFGSGSPLWTIDLMCAAAAKQFGVRFPPSTLHRHVTRAGLRPRQPQRVATERDDAEVDRWKREVWPTVTADVSQGAAVLFLDEAQVRADAPIGTTWSEQGVRPVVRVTGKRPRINIVSAVSWTGDLLFHTYNGSFNAALFTEFLRVLVEWAKGRRLVLVLDGLRVHFAKAVVEAVKAAGWDIRFVQLPAYAPQLNPDEHVWSHLKGHRMKRYPLAADETLADVVKAEMSDIARCPELVRSFFLHPDVHYLHDDAFAAGN